MRALPFFEKGPSTIDRLLGSKPYSGTMFVLPGYHITVVLFGFSFTFRFWICNRARSLAFHNSSTLCRDNAPGLVDHAMW